MIIIHYSEIGLKGKNRAFFEQKLKGNIQQALGKDFLIKKIPSAFLVQPKKEINQEIIEKLKKIFGIAYFVITQKSKVNLKKDNPKRVIDCLGKEIWEAVKNKKFKTFKVRAKRSQKDFSLISPQIERAVGGFIKQKSGAKVDLGTPEFTIYIELVANQAFFHFEKTSGPGGLPTTSGGKVISLLSGGIDSPVASWKIMSRGCKAIFCHFHSYPQTNQASIEKTKELAKILASWQGESKLYLIPFLDIQKEIIKKCDSKFAVIMYRRMMLRIVQEIAKKEGAISLVTGDALGQVASQTLENLAVISEAANSPIYRPLVGSDKEEIISLAKKVGTYEISIQPHQDCCSLFVPKHPATKAKLADIKEQEKKLAIKFLITKALGETKTVILRQ